jgi:protease-4
MTPSRILAAALISCLAGCSGLLNFRLQPLEESTVMGRRGPKIAQIDIEGLISETARSSGNPLAPPENMVSRVKEALDLAEDDKNVVALLLRIQSPGGTASASDTLYHEVLTWKKRTGRPVVAHFEGLATSGAYYIAMASDEIVCHPSSVTGSIGVLFAAINVSGLMEKVGIQNQTVTGGKYKDSGSPLRPMQPEERAQLQSVVDDLWIRFKGVVDDGRPKLTQERVNVLADGRIYSADQALEDGLVDRIGYLEDAVKLAEARAGVESSRVVVYHRPDEYRNNIYSRSPVSPAGVEVNLLPSSFEPLAPGFYYLWPSVLGNR